MFVEVFEKKVLMWVDRIPEVDADGITSRTAGNRVAAGIRDVKLNAAGLLEIESVFSKSTGLGFYLGLTPFFNINIFHDLGQFT